MEKVQITYKDRVYSGAFKIKGNMVIVYYNGREKGTHALGSPGNIGAQRLLAKQLLEDLIRPPGEKPSYLRG